MAPDLLGDPVFGKKHVAIASVFCFVHVILFRKILFNVSQSDKVSDVDCLDTQKKMTGS